MKSINLRDCPNLKLGLDPETASIFLEDGDTFFIVDEKIEINGLPGLPLAVYSPASKTLDIFEDSPQIVKKVLESLKAVSLVTTLEYTILPVERLKVALEKARNPSHGVLPASPADFRRKADVLEITAQLRAYGVDIDY